MVKIYAKKGIEHNAWRHGRSQYNAHAVARGAGKNCCAGLENIFAAETDIDAAKKSAVIFFHEKVGVAGLKFRAKRLRGCEHEPAEFSVEFFADAARQRLKNSENTGMKKCCRAKNVQSGIDVHQILQECLAR
jgi:hypothetical protein